MILIKGQKQFKSKFVLGILKKGAWGFERRIYSPRGIDVGFIGNCIKMDKANKIPSKDKTVHLYIKKSFLKKIPDNELKEMLLSI